MFCTLNSRQKAIQLDYIDKEIADIHELMEKHKEKNSPIFLKMLEELQKEREYYAPTTVQEADEIGRLRNE